MICPHCSTGIRLEIKQSSEVYPSGDGARSRYRYDIAHGFCPECNGLIIVLRHGTYFEHTPEAWEMVEVTHTEIVYPRKLPKRPLEPEVPSSYTNDFHEACATLDISPKASAAISRRLLQTLLREEHLISKHSLAKEIEEFVHRKGTSSHLVKEVDAVRHLGNFATHPLKDTNTGEIVEVELGEAEWLLAVLELMFDYTFVQPKRLEERKVKLNAKLRSAGKPPME